MIAANPLIPTGVKATRKSQGIVTLLAVLSLGMSISAVSNFFGNRPKYPMSPVNLPVGIVTFLNQMGIEGKVLNHPNNGGYLQWMLYPKYRIFMDMQVPFLFTDEDMYIASNMFGDRQVLSWVLDRYKPEIITVNIRDQRFKRVIEGFSEYTIVFFDDSDVLYINVKEHPDIAKKFEIRDIDPFSLATGNVDKIVKESGKVHLRQVLQRMLEIYPQGGMTNHLLGLLDKEEGAFEKAVTHAEVVIENFPDALAGYRLKGQALTGQKLFQESVPWYRRALEIARGPEKLGISKELGLVYKELGQYEKAYRLLRDSMNAFDFTTSYQDLYDLGDAAFAAGRIPEAALVFRLGATKVPRDDKEWEEKYRRYDALLRPRAEIE